MLVMATLHLRDVPDSTVDQLRRLAARERTSMNAIAVRELIDAAGQVDNAGLFASLPDLGVEVATVRAALDADRRAR
jgi:plasmid stability protein